VNHKRLQFEDVSGLVDWGVLVDTHGKHGEIVRGLPLPVVELSVELNPYEGQQAPKRAYCFLDACWTKLFE
jgi:hypothetical protein